MEVLHTFIIYIWWWAHECIHMWILINLHILNMLGCSPWGCEELDTTAWLHFHFSLSCTGEGNGNPLHCSYLENPRDGGAWWAAVCGVAQSWTRLKRLSSSSSSVFCVSYASLTLLKHPCNWHDKTTIENPQLMDYKY